jgi:hypothetical protein
VQRLEDAKNAPYTVGDNPVKKEQDEILRIKLGAIPYTDKAGIDKDVDIKSILDPPALSQTGIQKRAIIVDDFKKNGILLPVQQQVFDAAFNGNNRDHVMSAVQMTVSMMDKNPSNMTWDRINFPQGYREIIQAHYGDVEAATNAIMLAKSVNPIDSKTQEKLFSDYVNSPDFDSNFESMLGSMAGFWFDSAQMNETAKARVLAIAKNKMNLTGNTPESALRQAILQDGGKYNIDRYTGKYQMYPFSSLAESKGENADGGWAHRQLNQDMREYLMTPEGGSFPQDGDLPVFNYHPVNNFNSAQPAYIITWIDPATNMVKSKDQPWYPKFSITPEGIEASEAEYIKMKNKEVSSAYNVATAKANTEGGSVEDVPISIRLGNAADSAKESVSKMVTGTSILQQEKERSREWRKQIQENIPAFMPPYAPSKPKYVPEGGE